MKSVLVVGGAGYVGSRLVPALLERGYKVVVQDKLFFGKDGLTPCLDRVKVIAGDIRDQTSKILDGIDGVINLSGLSNDPTANYNPQANKAMNTDAAIRLAQMCVQRGIRRYVLASSCSVYYTEVPTDSIFTEDSVVSPKANYSSSKFAAERGILSLLDGKFCPVILRKGTIFGWSPRMRYDLVVNTFVKDAFCYRKLIVHAGGAMWRPMLHIEDAVDAYILALEADASKVRGQIFNVLNDNFKVIDIAKMVRGQLERSQGVKIDIIIQNVGLARSYRVDGSKFRKALRFKPTRTIAETVNPIWEHLESGIDPNHNQFYNIAWLELLCDMEKRLAEMGGQVF